MPGQLRVNVNGVWKDLPSAGPPGPIGPAGATGADSTVPGPPGPTTVSADANNAAVLGTDNLLYVPRQQIRSGHATVSTTGFGDGIFNFATGFPSGLTISVTITPHQVASDVFWFPVITNISDTAVQFFACAPSGYPFAGGNPPGQANVFTIANASVVFDYIAIGV